MRVLSAFLYVHIIYLVLHNLLFHYFSYFEIIILLVVMVVVVVVVAAAAFVMCESVLLYETCVQHWIGTGTAKTAVPLSIHTALDIVCWREGGGGGWKRPPSTKKNKPCTNNTKGGGRI